ncbi:MAG: hypothetical protein ABI758_02390 [Candidatus Woesebacteria bacterium]
MANLEQTVLIVDDMSDYRITLGALLRQNFPNARILKADGTESAVILLEKESDKDGIRLIIDGLEGEWKDMVNRALSFGIPKDNMIVFSATVDIQKEVEAKGIKFQLKPESPQLESTVVSMGNSLRL